jgi:hypothetical protein
MTDVDLSGLPESMAKTALNDDDAVQFKLVVPDSEGLSPQEARAFLARPVAPVRSSTRSREEAR